MRNLARVGTPHGQRCFKCNVGNRATSGCCIFLATQKEQGFSGAVGDQASNKLDLRAQQLPRQVAAQLKETLQKSTTRICDLSLSPHHHPQPQWRPRQTHSPGGLLFRGKAIALICAFGFWAVWWFGAPWVEDIRSNWSFQAKGSL